MPLVAWLISASEPAVADAIVHSTFCEWPEAEAALARMYRAAGFGKWARRVEPLQSAPADAVAAAATRPLRLMPGVEVRWVDAGLAAVEADLLARASAQGGAVAIDMEWQPQVAGQALAPVELLQLAVPSACWLLDVPALMREDAGAVVSLLRALTGGGVVLVGFGLVRDVERLYESYGELPRLSVQRALDLSSSDGLRGCVARCLGSQLDKAQQCSDWSQRPLSAEQLAYAALDAHVLLLLAAGAASPPDTPQALRVALEGRDLVAGARPLHFPLGPSEVDAALAAQGLHLPAGAADAAGTNGDAGAVPCKTLALVMGGKDGEAPERVVAIIAADKTLSLPLVNELLGRTGLRVARRDELVPLFGHGAGAMGPFGLRPPPCPVAVDAAVACEPALSVGAGAAGRTIAVAGPRLCEIFAAAVGPITS
eukprot:NODE_7763_length_1552_cov_6.139649.p2 GENE.NODE_7763_length_1552_cov_6.139649~~NODE_7763_length_1552_cov_6.139649.p2  ORF type:complete len:427 (+),score=158.44 NODE_7763_length_1552_cov_6.139649:217-1497(+)